MAGRLFPRQKTRVFGGKRYRLGPISHRSKRSADSSAKRARQDGFSARVSKFGDRYYVYTRRRS